MAANLAPGDLEFGEQMALLAGRHPRWPAGGASVRFLADCAANTPGEVRGAAFLRVNQAAVSMNIGNYWLARVCLSRFGVIGLEPPAADSGWWVSDSFRSVPAMWLVTPAGEGHAPAPMTTYQDACRAALEGPQGRLNTHPRKPTFPISVLRRFVHAGS